ncbi:VPA1269 family protein [Phyllobacterium sp. CCNWLW109]|uniref:VPA1269 family protein n=1 Tax=Phyllobacterium sp. CCNWLW109 TaxID=3127479 RepID=UPI003076B546
MTKLNETRQNYIRKNELSEIIEVALSEMVSVPQSIRQHFLLGSHRVEKHRAGIIEWTRQAIRANAAGDLRMSVLHFAAVGPVVTNISAEVIVRETQLGRSLEEKLTELDLYEKTFGHMVAANHTTYRRMLTLLLAGLCMASSGAKSIDELGPETIFSWLCAYRDASKDRFRTELWGKRYGVAGRCLKQLCVAFSGYFDSDAIFNLSIATRKSADGTYNLKRLLRSPPAHLKQWAALWLEYRTKKRDVLRGPAEAFRILAYYLDHQRSMGVDVTDPLVFVQSAHTPSLANYRRGKRNGPPSANWINEFSKLREFSIFLQRKFQSTGCIGHFVDLVTDEDKVALKNDLNRAGKGGTYSTAASMPLPMRYYNLLREILEEGASGWPGKHPFCSAVINKKRQYVPVLATYFLAAFELPERFGQFIRFDSGEGDPERFNPYTLKWDKNKGPLAGYWSNIDKKQPFRGYACRTEDPRITGFRINTNKTGNPFIVPWQNITLHRMLYDLRVWQETWNPISKPIGPKQYLENVPGAEEGKLEEYPFIFSLFRDADNRGRPPSVRVTGKFWLDILLEVQNRWNATCEPEDREDSLVDLGKNRQPESSRYTPHGMRVAGLTLLIQAGVPLEIISRLIAGHKTLLMTLYYMKVEPAMITNMMNQAQIAISAARTSQAIFELKNMSFENAKRRTVSTDPSALYNAMPENGGNRVLWADRDYGICPWGGTRCRDGGECIGKTKKGGKVTLKYASVEGESENCVQCRHFLTGPEWAEGLFGYGTLLGRRLSNLGSRINEMQSESRSIHISLQSEGLDEEKRIMLKRELKRTEQSINDYSIKQTILCKSFLATEALLQKIERLQSVDKATAKDKKKSLIAHNNTSVVEWVEVSEFEQTAFLAKYGRVYKSLYDQEVESSLRKYVDELAVRSLYEPIYMSRRTEEQKRRAYEAAVNMILEKAAQSDLDGLGNEGKTLLELGIGPKDQKLMFSADLEDEPIRLLAVPREPRLLV